MLLRHHFLESDSTVVVRLQVSLLAGDQIAAQASFHVRHGSIQLLGVGQHRSIVMHQEFELVAQATDVVQHMKVNMPIANAATTYPR